MTPRECAQAVHGEGADVVSAIVFGRERSGLRNEELDQCHAMLHIPCNPDFSSLNLAAAVQVVCYELRASINVESDSTRALEDGERLSNSDEMERFYEHLDRVLIATEFLDPDNPRQLRRRLRRLFNRADPSNVELNILRGILTAVDTSIAQK